MLFIWGGVDTVHHFSYLIVQWCRKVWCAVCFKIIDSKTLTFSSNIRACTIYIYEYWIIIIQKNLWHFSRGKYILFHFFFIFSFPNILSFIFFPYRLLQILKHLLLKVRKKMWRLLVLDRIKTRLESVIQILQDTISPLYEQTPLLSVYHRCVLALRRLCSATSNCTVLPVNIPTIWTVSGLPGRPKVVINIELMRDAGYTFNEMAQVVPPYGEDWKNLICAFQSTLKFQTVHYTLLFNNTKRGTPIVVRWCYRDICQALGQMYNAGGFVLPLAELIPWGSVSGGISRSQDADTVSLVLIAFGI